MRFRSVFVNYESCKRIPYSWALSTPPLANHIIPLLHGLHGIQYTAYLARSHRKPVNCLCHLQCATLRGLLRRIGGCCSILLFATGPNIFTPVFVVRVLIISERLTHTDSIILPCKSWRAAKLR